MSTPSTIPDNAILPVRGDLNSFSGLPDPLTFAASDPNAVAQTIVEKYQDNNFGNQQFLLSAVQESSKPILFLRKYLKDPVHQESALHALTDLASQGMEYSERSEIALRILATQALSIENGRRKTFIDSIAHHNFDTSVEIQTLMRSVEEQLAAGRRISFGNRADHQIIKRFLDPETSHEELRVLAESIVQSERRYAAAKTQCY